MGKKITVIGCGYVGLSMGVLLSQKNEVTIYDINKNKINCINNKKKSNTRFFNFRILGKS